MTESTAYQTASTARDRTHTLFARTMGLVALTAGLFTLGAYLARDLVGGWGIVALLAAFGCLIGLQFAVRKSPDLGLVLLGAFGLLMGVSLAPMLASYAGADPQALWQAGGATALSTRSSAW